MISSIFEKKAPKSKHMKVRKVRTYGQWFYYPACQDSEIFAAMLGQVTLTLTNIEYITRLGYIIFADVGENEVFGGNHE